MQLSRYWEDLMGFSLVSCFVRVAVRPRPWGHVSFGSQTCQVNDLNIQVNLLSLCKLFFSLPGKSIHVLMVVFQFPLCVKSGVTVKSPKKPNKPKHSAKGQKCFRTGLLSIIRLGWAIKWTISNTTAAENVSCLCQRDKRKTARAKVKSNN